ncbi:hypothetical protein EUGRSUZ_B01070 [Eucalyptus grandis]|uniref:Uncharacterized protein n=2 Tax=Eucalyptus grandis TaxID=71139 RepID=A0ACC3LPY3_EUCGR|nr:hypothetical protein EUGRSUZ_B01070 [Eucalyptus grandis]
MRRLSYIEKAKKDEERIAADIQDGLTVTLALICHLYLGFFYQKASSSLVFLWCNWKSCTSTNVYLL